MSAALVLCRLPGNGGGDTGTVRPVSPRSPPPRQAANEPLAPIVPEDAGGDLDGGFMSIADIQERWSCSRRYVYTAILEMEHEGYIKRLWLGRVQRIAVESLVLFERAHDRKQGWARAPERHPRAPAAQPLAGRPVAPPKRSGKNATPRIDAWLKAHGRGDQAA